MARKKSKAVPFAAADMANIAKANPYIQRLLDDSQLRDNVRIVIDSSRSAYGRLANGKAPTKVVLQDKKLQRDLRQAFDAARDAAESLQEAPKKRARKGLSFGRKLMLIGMGGALALAGSEKLRSKVLDTLFGAEEEFQYTPPATTPAATTPSSPVSAA